MVFTCFVRNHIYDNQLGECDQQAYRRPSNDQNSTQFLACNHLHCSYLYVLVLQRLGNRFQIVYGYDFEQRIFYWQNVVMSTSAIVAVVGWFS
jgi:hypothetical protein